jgi:protein phosphatase
LSLITRAVSKSDIGRVRQRNEDSVRVDGALGIALVADGMGGHPAGDLASRIAAEEVFGRLRALLTPNALGRTSSARVGERMADLVRAADQRVRAAGRDDPKLDGMGTTLTVLWVDAVSERFAIAHVGDSRAYRFRTGSLEQMTRDHTWVWEQVEAGRISKDQAFGHPHSNIITQAIGVDAPAEPDVMESLVRPGDVFLLCSDGLSGMLRDPQMAAVLAEALPSGLEAAADALVAAANREGGKDNISVALLAVQEVPD